MTLIALIILIVMLLLVTGALAAITRIVDSRPVMGLGMLALAMVLLVGVVRSQRHTRPVAVTAITTESVPAVNAHDSVASPEADDAVDDQSEDPETEAPPDSGSSELSSDITVETGEIIIPPRPEWVEADEVQTGDIHTMAVSSGPHETERECRKALDRELQKAVDSYIDWHLGPVYDDWFRASKFVRYELDEIKQRLIPPGKIYHEVIQVSFGPMHQMHAQLAFDAAFRRELDGRRSELEQHWKQWIVQQRLEVIAVGFGLLLALMGIMFTYFRLDTATRGFYSGRLKWAAAAAIAAVVAVAIGVAVSGALPLAKGAAILVLLTVGAVLAGRMLQE